LDLLILFAYDQLIKFCLTGNLTRLSGEGSRDLSIAKHGPHIDYVDDPKAASVTLEVFLPTLHKTATITRTVKQKNKPRIAPKDDDVQSVLTNVAKHPEITLSRREITRFVLCNATERATHVQELLRLDRVARNRRAFNSAKNNGAKDLKTAELGLQDAADNLRRHLELEAATDLTEEVVLQSVNAHRARFKVPAVPHLEADLTANLNVPAPASQPVFSAKSSLSDLDALDDALRECPGLDSGQTLERKLQQVDSDAELTTALRRRQLIEAGLDLIDDDRCPLCETEQDQQKLIDHLRRKKQQAESAETLLEELRQGGHQIAAAVNRILSLLRPLIKPCRPLGLTDEEITLTTWGKGLKGFAEQLNSWEGIVANRPKLTTWHDFPEDVASAFTTLRQQLAKIPAATPQEHPVAFFTKAQERVEEWLLKRAEREKARQVASETLICYEAYCEAADEILQNLYDTVQQDFSNSYRFINSDDESNFTAELKPTSGKLEFGVDFYERGHHPPAALHSEGHQDGMGLCLYLALMKHLFGNQPQLVVLDDVVMSVDAHHRRQLCGLLQQEFPHTQFVITTHDKAWFHQMQSTKLINRTTGARFVRWSLDDGPTVLNAMDVWSEIDTALANDDVSAAAHKLRRYMEFVSADYAGTINAKVSYRPDNDHDLGELFPDTLARFRKLLNKAMDSAKGWKDQDQEADVAVLRKRIDAAHDVLRTDDWMINKAVHFNSWENFTPTEFRRVVDACQELISCFRCDSCGSALTPVPRRSPETLSCACKQISFNLLKPSKPQELDSLPKASRETLW